MTDHAETIREAVRARDDDGRYEVKRTAGAHVMVWDTGGAAGSCRKPVCPVDPRDMTFAPTAGGCDEHQGVAAALMSAGYELKPRSSM